MSKKRNGHGVRISYIHWYTQLFDALDSGGMGGMPPTVGMMGGGEPNQLPRKHHGWNGHFVFWGLGPKLHNLLVYLEQSVHLIVTEKSTQDHLWPAWYQLFHALSRGLGLSSNQRDLFYLRQARRVIKLKIKHRERPWVLKTNLLQRCGPDQFGMARCLHL